jgi:hypothetical protein
MTVRREADAREGRRSFRRMNIRAIAGVVASVVISPAFAAGFCSGTRECYLTTDDTAASKVWQTCAYKSAGMHKTGDPRAAVEAAFAACATEENAMLMLVLTEPPHFTAAEAEHLRSELRSQLKAKMLQGQ